MSLTNLEELSKRELEIKKQLEGLAALKKLQRDLNSQLRKVKREKNILVTKMYFARKAKQVELANAAQRSQGSISRIVSEA